MQITTYIICMALIVPQYHSQTKRLLSASDDTSENELLLSLQNTIEDLQVQINVLKAQIKNGDGVSLQISNINGLQNEINGLQDKIDTHVEADKDTDPQNEIQTLSIDDIKDLKQTITNIETSISDHISTDKDTNSENEIQTLSITAESIIMLSKNGGSVTLGIDNIKDLKDEMNAIKTSIDTHISTDKDTDSENELQKLTIVDEVLTLSENGGSVNLGIDNIKNLYDKLCGNDCTTPVCPSSECTT
eukprot:267811_1